jgi:hypothetical protein
MRTITLELLRHGPSHNQLLSPLTQYLALCENHAAVTVHLPFEHNQFLHRLRALGYKLEDESRQFQLRDTAQVLGELLASIPGLTAELNRGDKGDADQLAHLRLILSASELALLPFELALAPNGFPGAGQSLLLQSQMPLCLTREIRRVAEEVLEWPQRPRILFAAAAPPGVGQVPVESHLLALRRVVDPWVGHYDESDTQARRRRVEEHLVFLPQATAREIEEQCASGRFTHVHLLAHGLELRENYDIRFGLALHSGRDRQGPADVLSGARLANILRAQQPAPDGLARPVVVSLASCNSGNVGSVAGAGASIAHALHEAGIPMVVAGQFPLSFAGSVRMVEVLYEGLLWGEDPRQLLNALRRRLHAEYPRTHDWASLTAYASLPPEFDRQLSSVQIERVMRSINVALNLADEATKRFSARIQSQRTTTATPQPTEQENEDLLEHARARIDSAKQRLEALLRRSVGRRARICGLLASTEKRQAEMFYSATRISRMAQEQRARDREQSLLGMERARQYYWRTFLADRSSSWGVVQYLSLTLILGRAGCATRPEAPGQEAEALWSLARVLSLHDLHGDNPKATIWALGNLIELHVLCLLMPPGGERPQADEAKRLAVAYAHDLAAAAQQQAFETYSTRRQMLRYIEWFGDLVEQQGTDPSRLGGDLQGLVEQIFALLPEGSADAATNA